MSEVSKAGRRPDVIRWAITVAALVGVLAVLYVILSAVIVPNGPANLETLKRGKLKELQITRSPQPPPGLAFKDAEGKDVTIASFKGKVTIVNFWATWCPPCLVEMPTFSRLAATYQGQPVAIVAISIDKDEKDAQARAFMAKNRPLAYYREGTGALPFLMTPRAEGMPTTVIYDKKGVERARVSGEADWSGPEAMELVRSLLAEP